MAFNFKTRLKFIFFFFFLSLFYNLIKSIKILKLFIKKYIIFVNFNQNHENFNKFLSF